MLLDQDVNTLREALRCVRSDMEGLRDPARRAAVIDGIELDNDDLDPFDAMLFVVDSAPARPRRRKKKRRR